MKFSRGLAGVVTVIVLGSVPVPLLVASASTVAPAVVSAAVVSAAVASCRSADHPPLAAQLARDIDRALRGRVSTAVAFRVSRGSAR